MAHPKWYAAITVVISPSRTLKMLTFVHSFFSSCGGLRFFRMDSPRISMR
jgi:hypothetical protein